MIAAQEHSLIERLFAFLFGEDIVDTWMPYSEQEKIIMRAEKVIDSCNTLEQLEAAEKYGELAVKATGNAFHEMTIQHVVDIRRVWINHRGKL